MAEPQPSPSGLPPRPSRSSTDAQTAPIVVHGFHVEGVAASPAPAGPGLLTGGAAACAPGAPGSRGSGGLISSSPQPVMVPPTFQTQPAAPAPPAVARDAAAAALRTSQSTEPATSGPTSPTGAAAVSPSAAGAAAVVPPTARLARVSLESGGGGRDSRRASTDSARRDKQAPPPTGRLAAAGRMDSLGSLGGRSKGSGGEKGAGQEKQQPKGGGGGSRAGSVSGRAHGAGRAPGAPKGGGAGGAPPPPPGPPGPPLRPVIGAATQSIFAHLPQHRPPAAAAAAALAAAAGAGGASTTGRGGGPGGPGAAAAPPSASPVHPAVLRLGLQYASGAVSGGSARAAALLGALRCVVADYQTPPGKVLARDLTAVVNSAVAFLVECRPLSAAMGAAVKALKFALSSLDPGTPDDVAKAALLARIDTYAAEKIEFAASQLAARAADVLVSLASPAGGSAAAAAAAAAGPGLAGFAASDSPAGAPAADAVILTYGHSAAVAAALAETHRRAPGAVRVVVVDARPALEGRAMLARLRAAGLSCTYVQLAALGYIMPEVTAVALGAAAVLANGVVLGRAGSAAVALAASAAGLPVLVLCETHKFQDRVQLDSITTNELRDPDELARLGGDGGDGGDGGVGGEAAAAPATSPLSDWRSLAPRLSLLNLAYDACPADCVTAVVTELGAMPPTSVPVVLREFRQEPQGL